MEKKTDKNSVTEAIERAVAAYAKSRDEIFVDLAIKLSQALDGYLNHDSPFDEMAERLEEMSESINTMKNDIEGIREEIEGR